jgi:hypothetical protein
MAWEGYRSRLCKCNDFNVYGLFGRDTLGIGLSLESATLMSESNSITFVPLLHLRATGRQSKFYSFRTSW